MDYIDLSEEYMSIHKEWLCDSDHGPPQIEFFRFREYLRRKSNTTFLDRRRIFSEFFYKFAPNSNNDDT